MLLSVQQIFVEQINECQSKEMNTSPPVSPHCLSQEAYGIPFSTSL